jgi:hypothetical protein
LCQHGVCLDDDHDFGPGLFDAGFEGFHDMGTDK